MKKPRSFSTILVTGGSGFIGTNFIRFLLGEAEFSGHVINLDKLTYAGNPENLSDIDDAYGGENYRFIHGDIADIDLIASLFLDYRIDAVVHFAAESHVDRSIHGPMEFVTTNVIGTATLLESARAAWEGREDVLFHHVSTDEVYGSLGAEGYFTEGTAYDPRSPYSASKASSDHLVSAYHHTYGIPVTISNCSNNYGPYQFPEKLIPIMIRNMRAGNPLPVYGDGKNIRDWLYVEDHNRAVWDIMRYGSSGETYNIGGENEWENITLVRELCRITAEETENDPDEFLDLISYVKDRPGHDRRYAIDCSKIKKELGWRQSVDFAEGLRKTVRWYLDNKKWAEHVTSGEYKEWLAKNYNDR